MEINQTDINLHIESGKLLLDYLQGKEVKPLKIRVAMSSYNGSTRIMSTSRVADAMQYAVIKDIAKDKEQLNEYIKATLPQYVPSKLLE